MYFVNVYINNTYGQDDLHKINLNTWLKIYSKSIIEQYGIIKYIKFTYEVIKGDD